MMTRRVGATGLRVSELTLGTLGWGESVDANEAHEMAELFWEDGGTTFDTSPAYGQGRAEEILGELIREEPTSRVITKAWGLDASRREIQRSLAGSLRRLGREQLDLFLVTPHPGAPWQETFATLRGLLDSGQAAYVGLNNAPGWMLGYAAGALGPGFLSAVEMEYSLLERGAEREVIPAAQDLGITVLAASSLGRGVLTGKYRHTVPPDSRAAASGALAKWVGEYLNDRDRQLVEGLVTAAAGLDVPAAAAALAWVRQQPAVGTAIIGPRTQTQLRALLEWSHWTLPAEIAAALAEVSAPTRGYPESR